MKTFDRQRRQRLQARKAERTIRHLNEWGLLDMLAELRNDLAELHKKQIVIADGLTERISHQFDELFSMTEAFTTPLTRYWKWKRGQLAGFKWDEENAFQGDLILFWIHWLKRMESAFPHAADLEPVRDLRRLLEDLRNGESSQLTKRLFDNWKALRKRGVRRAVDPEIVANYKRGLGDAYIFLKDVGGILETEAVKIIKGKAKQRGLKITSEIPGLAKNSSSEKLGDDLGITLFLDEFLDRLEKCDVRAEITDQVKEIITGYEGGKLKPSDWKGVARTFLTNNCQFIDPNLLHRCWEEAMEHGLDVILSFSANKGELKRYGQAKQD